MKRLLKIAAWMMLFFVALSGSAVVGMVVGFAIDHPALTKAK